MGIKTTPHNPFDYFETQAEINDFLRDCFNDEDPRVFPEALGFLIKKHGMADVAEATGLNRENLYRSFNGKTQPKWDTVSRVLRALNVNITGSAHA